MIFFVEQERKVNIDKSQDDTRTNLFYKWVLLKIKTTIR